MVNGYLSRIRQFFYQPNQVEVETQKQEKLDEFVERVLAGKRDFPGIKLEGNLSLCGKYGEMQKYLKKQFLADNPIIISGSDLSGIIAPELYLHYVIAKGTNFRGAHLEKALFTDANLMEANFSGANLEGIYFNRSNLSGANLSYANLIGAKLSEANLSYANLIGAKLSRADFGRAILRTANLEKAYGTDVYFWEADFIGANLSGAKLSRADFIGAKLGLADLRGAELKEAKFNRAFLSETKFNRADLRGANLEEVYISGTDFSRADLREAHLCFKEIESLDAAFLKGTKLPESSFMCEMHETERAERIRLRNNYLTWEKNRMFFGDVYNPNRDYMNSLFIMDPTLSLAKLTLYEILEEQDKRKEAAKRFWCIDGF